MVIIQMTEKRIQETTDFPFSLESQDKVLPAKGYPAWNDYWRNMVTYGNNPLPVKCTLVMARCPDWDQGE